MKSLLAQFLLLFVALGFTSLLDQKSASADITFTFTEAADGGVDVTGTGSGLVNRELGISSNDWDVQDFLTNFLVIGTGTVNADSASGTFTNVTQVSSQDIISFQVDDDGGASLDNDLDYDTAAVLAFDFDDEFTYSLTASFLPTSLTMSDLVVGTHIDVGRTQGAGIAEESFGITTVIVTNAVPEPSGMALLACIAGCVLSRRRRC